MSADMPLVMGLNMCSTIKRCDAEGFWLNFCTLEAANNQRAKPQGDHVLGKRHETETLVAAGHRLSERNGRVGATEALFTDCLDLGKQCTALWDREVANITDGGGRAQTHITAPYKPTPGRRLAEYFLAATSGKQVLDRIISSSLGSVLIYKGRTP